MLPCQALDHGSGYLLAFGALTALHRRMTEGGSWHVQVSLAQTGQWLRGLGRIDGGLDMSRPDFAPFLDTSASGFGELKAVQHSAKLGGTPAQWTRPSMPPGSHPPRWT